MTKRMGFIGTLAALVLGYSACGSGDGCENDFDCREPRVCRQGECINPNEGEGEAEGESNIPWYEGMCEEYERVLHKTSDSDIQQLVESCEHSCPFLKENPPRDVLMVCSRIYCCIESENCDEHEWHNKIFDRCFEEFGYDPYEE